MKTKDRHWSVVVVVDGVEVLTIESNCLSGLENVTDFRPEIIEAANNLLAFIGNDDEAFEFEDANTGTCDLCGDFFKTSDLTFEGKQMLCPKHKTP